MPDNFGLLHESQHRVLHAMHDLGHREGTHHLTEYRDPIAVLPLGQAKGFEIRRNGLSVEEVLWDCGIIRLSPWMGEIDGQLDPVGSGSVIHRSFVG